MGGGGGSVTELDCGGSGDNSNSPNRSTADTALDNIIWDNVVLKPIAKTNQRADSRGSAAIAGVVQNQTAAREQPFNVDSSCYGTISVRLIDKLN